jgi:putative spermidine/putrescine transport system substrate-binding protein
MTRRPRVARPSPGTALATAAVLVALTLTACGGTSGASGGVPAVEVGTLRGASPSATDSWADVQAGAQGQTVNWYMYGGDELLNTFVNGYVAAALRKQGVTLNQVKITSTSDAVNKVLGEKQAGRTDGGSVDAIWVNGTNFATGVQAGLWACGWDKSLPNSRYVDFTDPAVVNDFGVPVNGCESVWQQANSALVYDSSKLSATDVASVSSLLAWARANPGRFTYPALPDFTGSMAVRTILYDTIGGPSSLAGGFDEDRYTPAATKLWKRLSDVAPTLWRGGSTYPKDQTAVEKLYADGEVSAFFTYGPGATGAAVAKGQFPATTKEAVPSVGNIANVSFLAVPANAAHQAGALVLANVLQDPQTQLELYRAEGIYPGIDLTRTDAATQAAFAAVPLSPSVLPLQTLTRNAQPELASAYISRLEKDWKTQVLQK